MVSAKSPASAPLIVGFLTVIGVPLGLPMVTVSGLLLTPTFSVPKFSALGKIPMTGKIEQDGNELEIRIGDREVGSHHRHSGRPRLRRLDRAHGIIHMLLERAVAVTEKDGNRPRTVRGGYGAFAVAYRQIQHSIAR